MPDKSVAEYSQSANTLFHFMKEIDFLKDSLSKKALVPRYCIEDISYLELAFDDKTFNKVSILQKCFCDIPLHKLHNKNDLSGTGKEFDALKDAEKARLLSYSTHPEIYGNFALAFSKGWGAVNGLQPVNYLNTESEYTKSMQKLFKKSYAEDVISEFVTNDIFMRLAFSKPLHGTISRPFKKNDNSIEDICIYKNFHDENEWRYVPKNVSLENKPFEFIIANPNIINSSVVNDVNIAIMDNKYNDIWLKYDYDDLTYIIVFNQNDRVAIIEHISNLPIENFTGEATSKMQKNLLISKILVLDEIRKDF